MGRHSLNGTGGATGASGGDSPSIGVRLTHDQREWLGVLAESTGVTPSEFIRASIDLARQSGDKDPVGMLRRALDFSAVERELAGAFEDDTGPPGTAAA